MKNQDEHLQQTIEQLEKGVPMGKIIKDLPGEDREIVPQLRLAAAVRSMPHPDMAASRKQAQKEQVLAAMRKQAANKTNWLSSNWFKGSLVLGAALSVFIIVFVLGLNLYTAGPGGAHYATLMEVSGVVEVSSADTDWHFVGSGDHLTQGQRIRTYADSGATLVFFDGSRTTINPDTALTLEQINGGWGNTLQVLLVQNLGSTSHYVVPLRGSTSFFQVQTPSGKASVHGTTFNVDVSSTGESLFTVSRGKVQIIKDGTEVTLSAGQTSLVLLESDPSTPAFQFSIRGTLEAIQDNHWTAAGMTFTVTEQTIILGTPSIGDAVSVKGHILDSGERVADHIDYSKNDKPKLRFSGVVNEIGETSWLVGTQTILVNAETEIDSGIEVGNSVNVVFYIENEQWIAKSIERSDENNNTATPQTPTLETPTPDLTQTPEITPGPTKSGNYCDGSETQQHPEGAKLAQRYNVPYEEIMNWFCQHNMGFGEIDLAYSLSQETGKPVADIIKMRESGMSWGQIKQELLPNPTKDTKPEKTKTPKPANTKTPKPEKTEKPKPTRKP